MLDLAPHDPGRNGLTWIRPPAMPVDRLVVGRKPEEAAALLPRIFNLCRGAQEVAARLAFGLPVPDGVHDALHEEILRDHVLMLTVRLPRHFGGTAQALPKGWQQDAGLLRSVIFGTRGTLPGDLYHLNRAIQSGEGVFRLLGQVQGSFLPGEAACDPLPIPQGKQKLESKPYENSVAARWVDHPLLRATERDFGRGPFWRVLGRVIELDAIMAGFRLGFRATADGAAFASAARGTYAVQGTTEGGRVTGFRRVTPTDHLMAAGGVLDQSLARLPATKRGLAPLLMDILDPCVPLRLEERAHA